MWGGMCVGTRQLWAELAPGYGLAREEADVKGLQRIPRQVLISLKQRFPTDRDDQQIFEMMTVSDRSDSFTLLFVLHYCFTLLFTLLFV